MRNVIPATFCELFVFVITGTDSDGIFVHLFLSVIKYGGTCRSRKPWENRVCDFFLACNSREQYRVHHQVFREVNTRGVPSAKVKSGFFTDHLCEMSPSRDAERTA
jgi:hypothetical protein